ncbi:MAG: hypothetical protein WAR61_18570, partial [Candidatus Microthrix parvicella]
IEPLSSDGSDVPPPGGAPPARRPRRTGDTPISEVPARPAAGETSRPKLVDQRNDTSEIQQLATGGVRQSTGEVRHLTGEMKTITGQGQVEGPAPVEATELPAVESPLPPAAPPPTLPGEVARRGTHPWIAHDEGAATSDDEPNDPFPEDFDHT